MQRKEARKSQRQSGFEGDDRRKLLDDDKRVKARNFTENWILRFGEEQLFIRAKWHQTGRVTSRGNFGAFSVFPFSRIVMNFV